MTRTAKLLLASFGFYLGWWLSARSGVPVLWYYPVERTLEFTTAPVTVGISLYGRLLFAVALGAAHGLVAELGSRLGRRVSATAAG